MTEEITTGSQGALIVPRQHKLGVVVQLLDEGKYIHERGDGEFVRSCSFANLQGRPLPEHRRKIVVYELLHYKIAVNYEDGSEWEGELRFETDLDRVWSAVSVKDGVASGLTVPSRVSARAWASSFRADHEARSIEWVGGREDPERTLLLTLPRAKDVTTALIVVDLSGFSAADQVLVNHYEVRKIAKTGSTMRTSMGTDRVSGGKKHIVGSRAPGRYCVSVGTREQGWTSSEFEVKAGETKLLVPELRPCGTVVARILSNDGEVMADARLFIRRGAFPQWTSWVDDPSGWSLDGERCSVDAQGDCELYGVPPGLVEIEVCARKCDSVVATYDIKPGVRLDLGEIRLDAASGVVQVQLSNYRTDVLYEAVLFQTGASAVEDPVDFDESGYLDMQAVPLRSYTLLIRPKGGGVATTRFIELTKQEPVVALDVNMPE
ncbi:MAG: hypothetical protein H6839_16845 [Planctomycetes bacterium]|nr:hypothetical protein [Planctomycetota bacterium]